MSDSSSDDEKPTNPRVPASRAPPTTLTNRDAYKPANARVPASRAPATTLVGRDRQAQAPRVPASLAPATLLVNRDQTPRAPANLAPATMLVNRDQTPAPKVLDRSIFASKAPAGLASVFINQVDLNRAVMQTQIEELVGDERERQEAWAQEQIQKVTSCPDGYTFIRIPKQGYQCKGKLGTGGAHGISDELLAEGKGGILAINNKDKEEHEWTFEWDEMKGPYYPALDYPGAYRISTTRKTEEELERDLADRKRRIGW